MVFIFFKAYPNALGGLLERHDAVADMAVLVVGTQQAAETLAVCAVDVDAHVVQRAARLVRLRVAARLDQLVVREGLAHRVRQRQARLAVGRVAVQAALLSLPRRNLSKRERDGGRGRNGEVEMER